MHGSYHIDCPGCHKGLMVADEHLGQELACPHCKTVFVVPNTDPHLAALELTQNHQDLLRHEDREVLQQLDKIRQARRWNYALAAALLHSRMKALRHTVARQDWPAQKRHPIIGKKGKFRRYFDHTATTFFDIVDELHLHVVDPLKPAYFPATFPEVYNYVQRAQQTFDRMIRFHEQVHADGTFQGQPFEEIHYLMRSWIPYCAESLENLVLTLQGISNDSHFDPEIYEAQVMFVPPSIHRLYRLAGPIR